MLVEEQKLDGIVRFRAAFFKTLMQGFSNRHSPFSRKQTQEALIMSGFTSVKADGWSLDDKPLLSLLSEDKFGLCFH